MRSPTTSRSTVSLSESKLKEAKIAIEPARFDRIATGVAVVGVIQANSDRQVEVRPRAAGVVREVHVVLEQKVKRGDPLVTLDSPEIGTARLNLRARQRELSTARFEAAWRSEIAANVALLIPELRKGINQRRGELADDEEHADTHAHEPNKPPVDDFQQMRSTPGSSRSSLPTSSSGPIAAPSCKPTPNSTSPATKSKRQPTCACRTSSASTLPSWPGTLARGFRPSSRRRSNRSASTPLRRNASPTRRSARPRQPWSTPPRDCESWAFPRTSRTCSTMPTKPMPSPATKT